MGMRSQVWRRALLAAGLLIGGGAVAMPAASAAPGASAAPAAEEPLAVTVSPSTGLRGGQAVELTITGSGPASEQALHVAQCDAAVGTAPTEPEILAHCGGDEVVLPGVRPTRQAYRVQATFTSFTGQVVSCGDQPADCLITVAGEGGQPFAAAPIDMVAGALRLYATPTANLVAGAAVEVTVTGARASEVGVAQCGPSVAETGDVFGGPCGPVTTVPAGDGPAELVLRADDVLDAADGTTVTCGDDCVIAAATRAGDELAMTPIEFAGTDPEVHAVPSTGLADGQAVLVVATDVLPSVDGPRVWIFPSSGRWAVLECGRAVVADATISGILSHCAAPPGGGPVPGSASDLTVDIEAQATITSAIGTSTDCTSAPDACVIALARLEEDGAVSLLTGPLGFAPPS
jgi:hypothetical protein